MKKILLIAVTLLLMFGVNAQALRQSNTQEVEMSETIDNKDFISPNTFAETKSIMDYVFEEEAGSFTTISATGTAITPNSWDDGEFVIDLSGTFTFSYNLADYSTFNVSVNGAMVFGGSGDISLTNNLANNDQAPIAAPLWEDLRLYGEGTGDGLFYQIDNVSGEDVLTIEWNNIARYSYDGFLVSFQIKLYANSGNIEYIYSDMSAAANWESKAATATIGINDNEGAASAIFASITPTTPATVSYSVSNNTITGTDISAIADGTIYRFIPNFVANDLMAMKFMPTIFSPGVDTTFTVYVKNIGTDTQSSYTVNMTVNDGSSDVYTSSKSITQDLATGEIDTIIMDDIWTSVPEGIYTGTFIITEADDNTANNTYEAPIVVANTILMHDGIETTCNSTFYDTGGPDNDFMDNEDLTLTVYPASAGFMSKVDFSFFDCAGSSYDYLEIYDGTDVSAPLIVSSMDVGDAAMIATPFAASNVDGALTFFFHSSSVVPNPGWEATISCATAVTFHVTDAGATDVENALIEVDGQVGTTNVDGNAMFVLPEGDVTYTVTANFCDAYTSSYNVTSTPGQIIEVDLTCLNTYSVTFNAFEDFGTNNVVEGVEIAVTYTPTATVWNGITNVDGDAIFTLPATDLDFSVNSSNYTYDGTTNITVTGDMTVNIPLNEILTAPYALMIEQQNSDADVLFSWNNEVGFSDDFESYDDFVLTFGDWTLIDVDGGPTYGFSGVTFPNMEAPMAGIIFNPSQTDPPIDDCAPHSGDKFVAIFNSSDPLLDDDWVIAPQTTIIAGDEISYWARSGTDAGYIDEKLQVFVSTTTPDVDQFTSISPIETTTQTWTQYTYSLDAYAGQDIYVAIHCTSADQFYVCIDDFNIGQPAKSKVFESYTVFLNNDEYATEIADSSIVFEDLAVGDYTAKVFTNYTSGISDTAFLDFSVLGYYDLTFEVLSQTTPIEGASVTLSDGTETYNLTTDVDGLATQTDIIEGDYTYSVSATDFVAIVDVAYTLTETETITVQLDSIVSLYEFDNNMKLYPNPTSGKFFIDVNDDYNIVITDITGKIVYTNELTSKLSEIDLSNNSQGVYLVKLFNDEKQYQVKLILK